ncbi:MAG: abortive infection protein [Spirochaetes bacterium]|nr:MAG: abortive infection protein [Spirochaetota bacterium]
MSAPGLPEEGVFWFLLAFILAFLAYWLTIESPGTKTWFFRKFGETRGAVAYFIFNKLWGAFLFGILCSLAALAAFPEKELGTMGLRWPSLPPGDARSLGLNLGLPILLSGALVGGNWLRAKKIAAKERDFGRYPEIKIPRWTMGTVLLDLAFWAIYLFAYELLFRGTLLFPLAERLGPWTAIGINIALYAAVHIPKGPGEAIGALFLGAVLCPITLATGSIFTAFAVHAALAISNDLFAFYHRPDMEWAKGGRKR